MSAPVSRAACSKRRPSAKKVPPVSRAFLSRRARICLTRSLAREVIRGMKGGPDLSCKVNPALRPAQVQIELLQHIPAEDGRDVVIRCCRARDRQLAFD